MLEIDSIFKQPRDRRCCDVKIRLRILAARCARVVHDGFAQKNEGVGNAGRPMHPQPRVRNEKAHEHSHHRYSQNYPASPHAMVLTVSFVLLCPKNLPEWANGRFSTNRPSRDLSPFVLKGCEPDGEPGTDPVSSSTRTVAWASSPNRARKGAG